MEIHEAVEAGPLANTCGTPELGSCKETQVVQNPAVLQKCRVPENNALYIYIYTYDIIYNIIILHYFTDKVILLFGRIIYVVYR